MIWFSFYQFLFEIKQHSTISKRKIIIIILFQSTFVMFIGIIYNQQKYGEKILCKESQGIRSRWDNR